MAKGDRVTRAAYNNLQSQVASIMGVGSGQSGYGQEVLSRQANIGEVVTANLFNTLRTDMAKAWTHQNDTAVQNNTTIGPPNLELLSSGQVITSNVIDQYTAFINAATIGILDNRAAAHPNQLLPGVGLTNTPRTTAWGGNSQSQVISHTVTVTFNGYTKGSLTVSASDHARVFFNAGGSIQVSASRTGGTASTKNTTWSNMLSQFGILTLGATGTSITGTASNVSTATGFFNLTVGAGLTTLMTQTGPTGAYSANDYIVQVNRPTASTIQFTITFRDDAVGTVDESVGGTLTSIVQCTRPEGENVDVPAPTGTATAIA